MRVVVILAITLLLAGCTSGNSVTIASQGFSGSSMSKSLECGETGTISLGVQGAGQIDVQVTDGDGAIIYEKDNAGAGQDGESKSITGAKGTWELTVDRPMGYAGQFGIVLTC